MGVAFVCMVECNARCTRTREKGGHSCFWIFVVDNMPHTQPNNNNKQTHSQTRRNVLISVFVIAFFAVQCYPPLRYYYSFLSIKDLHAINTIEEEILWRMLDER